MLAALCLAMVFAICLSSYIALCYTSLTMSSRNLMNSLSSELAETGVEQALYARNNGDWTGWSLAGSTATAAMTMTSNGLVATSSSPTPLVYGNGVTGQVNITVNNYTSNAPSITSQGVMTMPNGTLTSSGAITSVSSTLTYTAPTIPPNITASAPFFVNAVAATSGSVRFTSGGTVDSFSSVNPTTGLYQNYSNSGPSANNTASAVVLSQNTNSLGAMVLLGTAVVNGYAVGYTSQYPGTIAWLSFGSAQVVGPSTPSGTDIDSSRLLTNPLPYQPVFNEKLPSSPLPFPGGCDDITSYPQLPYVINQTSTLGSQSATIPTVYDIGNGIQLSGNSVLSIDGPVVLICYDSVSISGNAEILLTHSNSSLTIFEEHGSISIGGNGITFSGAVPLAKQVLLLSTTNNSSTATVTISTNTPFYGAIYFPYLPVIVSSTSPTIYGSIVGASVTFQGSPTIHYDEALRKPDSYVYSAAFQSLSSPITVSGLVQSVP